MHLTTHSTQPTTKEISFTDLRTQYSLIKSKIDQALAKVFEHGQFILGPEVTELENKLSAFCGAKHAVSCANGTDALMLVLMAKGIKPGDAVLVPTFTYVATAEAVAKVGGHPVMVDVSTDTFNMDLNSLKAGLRTIKANKLKPKGIIAVDLFGHPADYDELLAIANENKLWLMCDAAQSFGGSYKKKKVGTFGLATTTSFFPSKTLGCYGDGGCVFTDDEALVNVLKSLRVHGQGISKYDTVRIGINSRLDTIQAAILLEKLKLFPDEIVKRQKVAAQYTDLLQSLVDTPIVKQNCQSAWHQYTVRMRDANHRAEAQAKLKERGVPTMIYYQKPIHKQEPYKRYLTATPTLGHADYLASTVLSLPMSPYLNFSDSYVKSLTHAFK